MSEEKDELEMLDNLLKKFAEKVPDPAMRGKVIEFILISALVKALEEQESQQHSDTSK